MSTVTKRELVRQVAAHAFCSYAQAQEMVDALFTGLREQLIEGHRIEVRGFGVLHVKDTKAKPEARNPRTGERVFAHRTQHGSLALAPDREARMRERVGFMRLAFFRWLYGESGTPVELRAQQTGVHAARGADSIRLLP